MGRKEDKKRMKGLQNNAITIQQFLSIFLGVRGSNLQCSEMTHKDLKDLFPDLKRTSFDQILDDPAMIYNGEAVLVLDGNNKLIPYLVEEQKKNLCDLGIEDVMAAEDWVEEPVTWVKEKPEIPEITNYDLESMSTYELEQLMHVYHASRQVGNFQKVRREVISRNDSKKSNRDSRAKAKKKEMRRRRFDDED